MEGKFELQFEDNEYYLVDGNTNDTIATTDKVLLKKDGYMGKLSIKNCEDIVTGYDLDELAEEYNGHPMAVDWLLEKRGFKDGLQKALEILGNNKFSELDMRIAYDAGCNNIDADGGPIDDYNIDFQDTINSLQQTEWDVEIVMDICGDKVYAVPEIVLDADGCLILKRI